MSHFAGGSAYAMCQQISEGYLLVTERNFRRLQPNQLNQLQTEIDKVVRSIRSEPQPEEVQEIQKRNRRLQRLSQCRLMIQTHRARRR